MTHHDHPKYESWEWSTLFDPIRPFGIHMSTPHKHFEPLESPLKFLKSPLPFASERIAKVRSANNHTALDRDEIHAAHAA